MKTVARPAVKKSGAAPPRGRVRRKGTSGPASSDPAEITQRLDEELRSAEKKYATILATVQSGYWLFDDRGRLLEVNDAYCRMSGYTREELLALRISDLEANESPREVLNRIEQTRRRGFDQFESRHRRKDGTVFDVDIRASYLDIEGGRFVVLAWDISERKRAENALKESEQKCRQLVEHAPTGIYEIDFRTRKFVSVNDVMCELVGYSREELLAMDPFDILDPPSQVLFSRRIHKWLAGEKLDENVEYKVRAKDGREIYAVLSVKFTTDEHGKPLGATVIGHDITERRKAEQDVAYQALLLGQVSDGVIGSDADLRITYWNKGAQRMYGFTEAEALGRTAIELLRPAYAAGERERIFEELDRRGTAVATISTRHKNGTKVIAEVNSTRLKDASGGKTVGFVVVYRDVTDQKRREARISKLTDLYLILSRVNEAIVRTRDEESLYGEVCRVVAGNGKFPLVWIGTINGKDVVPAASGGPMAGYLEGIQVQTEGPLGAGPTGTCIRENHFVVNDDFDSNARTAPWREAALRHGFRASASFPLRREGRAIGAITLYSAEPARFDAEQVGLLEALAADISYALDAIGLESLRTAMERDLRRTREYLESLIDNANAPIIVWDPKFIITRFNRAFERLTGRKARDVIGLSVDILFPQASRDESRAYTLATLQGERWETVEIPILQANGSVRTVLWNSANIYERDGTTLSATIAQGQDITERVQAEKALEQRKQELQELTETLEERVADRTAQLARANEMLQAEITERLRLVAAVEQAGEGVAITDLEWRIIYTNPAFERMSERSSQEIFGRVYLEIVATEGLSEEIAGVAAEGETWRGRDSRKTKDRQSIELDVTVTPVRDRKGRVVNYLALERDVTPEVRLQEHLLQRQKLEALGTLAGGIAHDFNNILNPIFINTEMALLDATLSEDVRCFLGTALTAANRGRDLVKQVISFSRQKEKERKPIRVGPMVEEALKFLRSSLPSSVEIRESIGSESGCILGDPAQIQQVVMNLCNNAAYSMRETGGEIAVSLDEVDVDETLAARNPDLEPGRYVRLAVMDTGTGMTPDVMERAFDPFFTTKKPGEGSGLGLAVVRGIVKDHGGAITVFSQEGRGSTFNVFLPQLYSGEPPSEAMLEKLARGNERILLVDDEAVQVESIRELLVRLGYEVTAETDSRSALERFRDDPAGFDLIITDQTMPHMTGTSLAEHLLRIRPGLPIILCTGFSDIVDAEGAKAKGIRQFLMKPYSIREMAATLRQALGDKPE